MSTMQNVFVPVATPMPRGARWFGQLLSMLLPARRPATVASTREQEAAEVRELARSVQHSDPGFAADLYAAADRHEGGR